MRRRSSSSITANPILIGAATVLVVVVAVFLAYNANNGLPFVPTYQLNVNAPSGANLVPGNDVRIGGARVGTVAKIVPKRGTDGTYYAQLQLKLQTSLEKLPRDSTFQVRPKSVLGLKYLAIQKGTSKQGWDSGATVPVTQATPVPVQIDDVFNMFDDKTRAAQQIDLNEFGNALAGRGSDINRAIEELNPLLTNLVPVMQNLSSDRTRLGQLLQALERTTRILAPVAQTQADMFVNLDKTFTALSDVRPQIQQSIVNGPPALDAAIQGFPAQREFIANSADLFHELRPGVRALRTAAPDLADAFTVGERSLRRSVALNDRLIPTFQALDDFAKDPATELGIKDLQTTSDILRPTIAYLKPAQTVCNYMTLWFRNIASLLSDGDANGTWQRFIIVASAQGPNNEGGPASKPADGPSTDNHLHTNPYPNTASPGQPTECEAGNENYLTGRTVLGNVPGTQAAKTEKTTRSLTG
jgi:virulence factor Mce-like protein